MNSIPYDFRNRDDRSKLMKSSSDTVIYCSRCGAPVVDSPQYKAGHQERMGHWPEEKKK
jgi:hypothetical protein